MCFTSAMIARWRSFFTSSGNSWMARCACSSIRSSFASSSSLRMGSSGSRSAQAAVDEAQRRLAVRFADQPADVLRERNDHALALLGQVARKFLEGKACLLFDQLELRQELFRFHARPPSLLSQCRVSVAEVIARCFLSPHNDNPLLRRIGKRNRSRA